MSEQDNCALNTDRELWREREGDYYVREGETLDDIPKERVWYLAPLDGTVPEYRWTNANFIKVPTMLDEVR